MRPLLGAARALWAFVVGDDWLTGLGLIAGLALTALLAGAGVAIWWLMPLAVLSLLCTSLWRSSRKASEKDT